MALRTLPDLPSSTHAWPPLIGRSKCPHCPGHPAGSLEGDKQDGVLVGGAEGLRRVPVVVNHLPSAREFRSKREDRQMEGGLQG